MIVAINYSSPGISPFSQRCYSEIQQQQTPNLLKFGVDKVVNYTPNDLSESFKKTHSKILKHQRGGGYFIWKPYIILHALLQYSNDTIVYIDSDWELIQPITELTSRFKDGWLMAFDMPEGAEKKWSKRDALLLMGCDFPEYTDTSQRTAGMSIWKSSPPAIQFLIDWLNYCGDSMIVTDEPSILGDDYPSFVENRHDQTVYSLLTKKYRVTTYRDPSQYGLPYIGQFSNSSYPQVVQIHHW